MYNPRYIIAGADITSRGKLFAPLRGKVAKELYRCGKGVVVTSSIIKPITYAGLQVATELSSGFVYSTAASSAEAAIGYISGFGFVRWVYKATDIGKIKQTARLCYNILGLPLTIYAKGTSVITDFLQIGTLEEKWFGERVYIFDDNRLWIEKNFTISDVFKFSDRFKMDDE